MAVRSETEVAVMWQSLRSDAGLETHPIKRSEMKYHAGQIQSVLVWRIRRQ